jgi:RimJ/RimL family protein N-acetyltransferase
MPTLQTERLILRMFCDADFDAFAALCADHEVMRYLGDGKPLSRVDAWRSMAAILGHWQLRGYGLWAVEERATGALVGRIGCYYPEGWPGFEVGWTLRHESWGCGYATEAARAALRFAFEKLDQPHVISLIHPDNERSIRVAERIGETLEGRTEVNGLEALVYGIRREQWQLQQQQQQQQ